MIRLFVTQDLEAGLKFEATPEQAHYLVNVMRLAVGAELRLFNGRDGEWAATLAAAGKRGATLAIAAQTRPQTVGPDLELVVALIKRARLETIVEKAAELGARRVRLAITERTNAERTRVDRLAAIATEAAEQTGRLDVPSIEAPQTLDRLLADWPSDRPLMFCDEAGDAPPSLEALTGRAPGPWAVLIGPEGGFSAKERALIRALPAAVPVSLGPRILRADTAAISALTLWQAALGDLRGA
ncbi:MAG TPA: 16S rRNA (uracil(1498)-N(3))-methyltransferase [Caulobacteraceae bacterium]|nr:16S rRNA (uracil(1498)-N(3))-methyltransferase [Caulobacteraceae bacterium]